MPKVSIGMPVYNGENYLRKALESLLAQTFTDFELIISDNASNDATESICRELAEQDKRIRYYRADKNYGASWNHGFVINKATAEYFKLAAHDDVCLPTHLEECVNALDANPDSPLAYTRTNMQFEGESIRQQIYHDPVELQSTNAAIRFGDLINEAPPAFPVFGVIRLAKLRSIPGFESYKASDRVVLTRLALMGPFALVTKALFVYRWHDSNASNLMANGADFYTWWNPDKGQTRVYPELRLAYEFLRSAFLVKLSLAERKAVLREAASWCYLNRKTIFTEISQLWGKQLPPNVPLNMIQRSYKRQARQQYKNKHYG